MRCQRSGSVPPQRGCTHPELLRRVPPLALGGQRAGGRVIGQKHLRARHRCAARCHVSACGWHNNRMRPTCCCFAKLRMLVSRLSWTAQWRERRCIRWWRNRRAESKSLIRRRRGCSCRGIGPWVVPLLQVCSADRRRRRRRWPCCSQRRWCGLLLLLLLLLRRRVPPRRRRRQRHSLLRLALAFISPRGSRRRPLPLPFLRRRPLRVIIPGRRSALRKQLWRYSRELGSGGLAN